MEEIEYILRETISPYVNCIMVAEDHDEKGQYKLPLYADGYPGIMFQQSKNGFYLQPKNKKLSELFLYGQTLTPISLEAEGPYKFVVFQLYPFASKHLLGVDPRQLNDECYDLLQITNIDIHEFHQRILNAQNLTQQIEIISDLVEELIGNNLILENDAVQRAIKMVIDANGMIKIKDLCDASFVTERTLERNFRSQIGLSPKQFAKIIQFQTSLSKLTQANFDKLIHVGLDSGFTDQSHFIRVFKIYTGQTPSYYLTKMEAAE